jgi:serine/threonine protein kinase
VGPPSESVRPNTRYRLDRGPLDEGSFAQVFRAENRETGEVVALKRAKNTPIARARIKREIEAQAILAPHPNIMPILDHDPGYKWYTMPLAEGTLYSLRDELDEETLASIVLDLANALDVAHHQDMIHRDISPKNILALPTSSGSGGRRWVVADWGMVSRLYGSGSPRLTRTGMGMGTPGFDAPEMDVDPSSATAAADVYSLGRVVAWFVTGTWPASGHPLLPDTPVLRWRLFVKSCTEPRVADRIANMSDLCIALEKVFTEYDEPPARRASRLLEGLLRGESTKLEELVSLALAHPEDPVIQLDRLARIPTGQVREWAALSPNAAAQAAGQVAQHLVSSPWEDRDKEYVGTPLGFVFAILQTLVDGGHLGDAQDVAAKFFIADAHWRYPPQRVRTVEWLVDLAEPAATAIAPVLAGHEELIEYYRPSQPPRSGVLAGIFGS